MKRFDYEVKFSSAKRYTSEEISAKIKGLFYDSTCDVGLARVTEVDLRTVYPSSGARQIEKVVVSFNGKVSKDRAEEIAGYWGSINYVGKLGQIDWKGNDMIININVSESTSSDVAARKILELLVTFLEEGTPTRMTQGGTRAFNGLGQNTVKTAVGFA